MCVCVWLSLCLLFKFCLICRGKRLVCVLRGWLVISWWLGSLVGWLVLWLAGRLVGIGWLVGGLVGWLVPIETRYASRDA